MLAIPLLLVFLGEQLQSRSAEAFDTSVLERRIAARERMLSAFAWDFETHALDASGTRVAPNAEPNGPPQQIGRLLVDGVQRRVELRDGRLLRDTLAVWDGAEARVRITPVPRAGSSSTAGSASYEEGGPIERVLAGYLPDSFGIGYCGFALSHWFAQHRFADLGIEPVRGSACRKLLMRMHLPKSAADTAELDAVRAVLWLDEQSLLVLRAVSLVRAELAAEPSERSEQLVFNGRRYAPQSTWDVLATTRVGEFDLPVLGRFSARVPGTWTAYEIELRPQALPQAGWPTETFELPIPAGAFVRDARTGASRVQRHVTTAVSQRNATEGRAPARSRCPGSDS